MAAPTLVAEYEGDSWTTTATKTASVTTAAGDLLVTVAAAENGLTTLSTPTGGTGVTWAAGPNVGTTGSVCRCAAWSATPSAQSFTQSVARGGSAGTYGFTTARFSGSSGVGPSPASTTAGGSQPSLTITTTQANSGILVIVADWNAVSGTSYTYRQVNGAGPTPLVAGAGVAGSTYRVWAFYYADAGAAGAKTVGITAPSGQAPTMVAVEILGTSGSPPGQGSGVGSVAFTGAASGKRVARASASGSTSFSGSSAGKRAPKASAAGALTFVGSAVGDAPNLPPGAGSGTGSLAFTGTATGKRVAKASNSGTVTFTGSASGAVVRRGTGTGSLGFAGTATGKRTARASGNGTLAFVGTAAGKRAPKATGTGGLTFAGSASGNSPTPGLKEGFGVGSLAWLGTAAGRRSPKGGGSGTVALVGAGVGVRAPLASGVGSVALVGTAVGSRPLDADQLPVVEVGTILPARFSAAPAILAPVVTATPARFVSGAPLLPRITRRT